EPRLRELPAHGPGAAALAAARAVDPRRRRARRLARRLLARGDAVHALPRGRGALGRAALDDDRAGAAVPAPRWARDRAPGLGRQRLGAAAPRARTDRLDRGPGGRVDRDL